MKLSVLIPVYNGERYLSACLQSLRSQTFRDFEVILGDDGSQDRSSEIIQEFAGRPFRIMPSSVRLGLFRNVNRLLKESTGEAIRVLCQDDMLSPDCLAAESDFLDQHPEVGMLISKSTTMDIHGNLISKSTLNDLPDNLSSSLALQQLYYHGCIAGNLSTVIFRRKLVERLGPFDPSYTVAGDYEMWARMCAVAPLGILHRHLVFIRLHQDQLSKSRAASLSFVNENRKVRATIFSLLPNEIKSGAKSFELKRQNVLDFHFAVRELLAGRAGNAWRVIRGQGFYKACVAFFYWLVTLNNRVNYPCPVWLIPAR